MLKLLNLGLIDLIISGLKNEDFTIILKSLNSLISLFTLTEIDNISGNIFLNEFLNKNGKNLIENQLNNKIGEIYQKALIINECYLNN